MDEKPRDAVSMVETIVTSLVDEPDQVEIVSKFEENAVLIEINVAATDISKIIGSNGRVIKAIRTLARSVALINNISRIDVEIVS